MNDLLPAAGTVDFGSLIDAGIHAGDGSDVDDGTVACTLPDAHDDENQSPRTGVGVEADVHAVLGKESGEHTAVCFEEPFKEESDDGPRDEVRQDGECLGYFLHVFVEDLVKDDGQCHRGQCAEEDEQDVQVQRITDDL